MPTYALSKELAASIVEIANHAGVKTKAVLTDMNQSLAYNAGNALEVREAVEYLMNRRKNPRLHTVNMALCIPALTETGLAKDEADATQKLEEALSSGKALEVFGRMVTMLGGPADFCERYDHYLPKAPIIQPIYAPETGIIESMDTIAVGMSVVGLGGGRIRPSDSIDHSVGLENIINLGTTVDAHTPLCTIHAKDQASWEEAKRRVLAAITIGENMPEIKEVYEIIG